jgi:opacity protein-like surface antigen
MLSRTFLLATAALIAIPSGAAARDGRGYIGVNAGIIKPQNLDLDYQLRTVRTDNGITLEHKSGLDADLVLGYDFGFFRVEGELGHKRAGLEDVQVRPTVFATTGRPAIEGRTQALSAMANLLLDFGSDEGLQVYAGGGVGGARFDVNGRITGPGVPLSAGVFGKDRSLAWQLLAGIRLPVNYNVDLGLKYRFFNADIDLEETNSGPADERIDGRFRSHSVLASLIFNFGSPPAPPPVVTEAVPPPPPPPPPPTQTCPDGSVILATDACPVPPPPPPPPPPAPERG